MASNERALLVRADGGWRQCSTNSTSCREAEVSDKQRPDARNAVRTSRGTLAVRATTSDKGIGDEVDVVGNDDCSKTARTANRSSVGRKKQKTAARRSTFGAHAGDALTALAKHRLADNDVEQQQSERPDVAARIERRRRARVARGDGKALGRRVGDVVDFGAERAVLRLVAHVDLRRTDDVGDASWRARDKSANAPRDARSRETAARRAHWSTTSRRRSTESATGVDVTEAIGEPRATPHRVPAQGVDEHDGWILRVQEREEIEHASGPLTQQHWLRRAA